MVTTTSLTHTYTMIDLPSEIIYQIALRTTPCGRVRLLACTGAWKLRVMYRDHFWKEALCYRTMHEFDTTGTISSVEWTLPGDDQPTLRMRNHGKGRAHSVWALDDDGVSRHYFAKGFPLPMSFSDKIPCHVGDLRAEFSSRDIEKPVPVLEPWHGIWLPGAYFDEHQMNRLEGISKTRALTVGEAHTLAGAKDAMWTHLGVVYEEMPVAMPSRARWEEEAAARAVEIETFRIIPPAEIDEIRRRIMAGI